MVRMEWDVLSRIRELGYDECWSRMVKIAWDVLSRIGELDGMSVGPEWLRWHGMFYRVVNITPYVFQGIKMVPDGV